MFSFFTRELPDSPPPPIVKKTTTHTNKLATLENRSRLVEKKRLTFVNSSLILIIG